MLCEEKKYQKVRQILLDSSKEPDSNFSVEFFQPEDSYGWIDITITSSSYKTTIETSYVYDPYYDFIWWLEAIYLNKIPQLWIIDEEGRFQECFVYALDSKRVRFIVINENNLLLDDWNESSIVLDVVISKEKFIKEFYFKFKNFVENKYKHDLWESGDLREYLKRLKESINIYHCEYIHTYCYDKENQ